MFHCNGVPSLADALHRASLEMLLQGESACKINHHHLDRHVVTLF